MGDAGTASWRRSNVDLGRGIGGYVPTNLSTYARMTRMWDWLDELGVDYLAHEDHLLSPSEEEPDGAQFECWSLLAAMAERTSKPLISALVSPAAFRNPAVVAKAAVTIDHISGGRFMLGLGAGWFAREYAFAGLDYERMPKRVADLENVIRRCREIWADPRCLPRPVNGDIPVLIGGAGARTIPLVARVADAWNAAGPLEDWRRHDQAVTAACEAIGRDPASLLRTAAIEADEFERAADYRDAGADLVIFIFTDEIARDDLQRLLRQAAR